MSTELQDLKHWYFICSLCNPTLRQTSIRFVFIWSYWVPYLVLPILWLVRILTAYQIEIWTLFFIDSISRFVVQLYCRSHNLPVEIIEAIVWCLYIFILINCFVQFSSFASRWKMNTCIPNNWSKAY